MKFVLAAWGSRGEIEPCAAVGRELLRRGHDVCMAVPPDLAGIAEVAGIVAVPYGLEVQAVLDAYRDFWTRLFHNFWNIRDLIRLGHEVVEPGKRCWEEMSRTLTSLADGADLLFTTLSFEDAATNVAEYHDIPLATLHWFPLRPNGQLLPFLPKGLGRSAMRIYEWLTWRMTTRKLEDAQRRELGLPKATTPAPRRMIERKVLEIQAYDEVCFPGLAAEWAKFDGQRPFVGTLTLESPTDADDEALSWIAAGRPPIFFGFGSIPVASAAETLAMISGACEELGERALVGAGWSDFSDVPRWEHVKVVGELNYAAIFPACRAVVHRGSSGITDAGLRAGVPTLVLSTDLNQTLTGAMVKRLKVGAARRFSSATRESLVADLRTILGPDYVARSREFARRMTKSTDSAVAAADHLENFARLRRIG
ncbi:glycosyltransferase [Mycobacterium celatum]|uniref:Glycosyl transferase family 1 n=1 Tax=Mycobacterium celatum TaxID=28045 RepID=A0A1X1RTW2_MYCCE|nr:glycosyltransferase [Mycobacterium celatum]ORV16690.1 glycosyl transferase family 1 [Mycobacterium celatum]PIB79317.1 glycosyltransferase [Mycobacterium celatum]